MHTESTILIQAPLEKVFATTSDLARWPAFLPHYRYVEFLERKAEGGVIRMAALRSGIPVSWVSELRIDPKQPAIHFRHLKAFTQGMVVVWRYQEESGGTRVTILHDLKFRVPLLAPLAEPVIGGFFIHHIAGKTLASFRSLLEKP